MIKKQGLGRGPPTTKISNYNKSAVITGAGSGIGRATSIKFAEYAHSFLLTPIKLESLMEG